MSQCYGLHLYCLLKVVNYENVVSFCRFYANDGASDGSECTQLSVFEEYGRHIALPEWKICL